MTCSFEMPLTFLAHTCLIYFRYPSLQGGGQIGVPIAAFSVGACDGVLLMSLDMIGDLRVERCWPPAALRMARLSPLTVRLLIQGLWQEEGTGDPKVFMRKVQACFMNTLVAHDVRWDQQVLVEGGPQQALDQHTAEVAETVGCIRTPPHNI